MHKNSYIYIEVPNFKNLVRSWDDSIYLAHLSNFSERNLIYFLQKNNLEIIFFKHFLKQKMVNLT